MDSSDRGDNGAIGHDGPVQLNLLGRCDARVWSGGSGSAQVPGGAILILKLSRGGRTKRLGLKGCPPLPPPIFPQGSASHLYCHGSCWSQGFPWPRDEWAHLSSGQWSGRGAHRQCGLAQEFSWGKGSTVSWSHDQAPLSAHPEVLLPAPYSLSPQLLLLSTLRASSRLWGPRSL